MSRRNGTTRPIWPAAGLLLLLAAGGCGGGGTSAPTEPVHIDIGDNRPGSGWAFGDSISHGKDSLFSYRMQSLNDAGPLEPGYRVRLEQLFAADGRTIRMTEDGEPGTVSAAGVSRIDRAVRGRPAFLVLLYGTNDSLFGVSPSRFESNIRFIVERCRANKTIVVLCTLPPVCSGGSVLPRTEPYSDTLRSLAAGLDLQWGGVFLADLDAAFRKRGGANVCRLLHPGGTHPTKEGYELIAETVYARLEHVSW